MRGKWHWLLAPLAIAVLLLLGYGWYRFDLLPVDPNAAQAVNFIIPKGESTTTTAERLQKAHIVRSSTVYMLYLTAHGLRGKVQSGNYELKPSYSTEDVIDILTNGRVAVNRITVPEGWTVAQIRKLAESKSIKPADFDQAQSGDYGADFLVGRPAGITLEGYLFPDSYTLPPNSNATQLITNMLANFNQKVTGDIRQNFTAEGLTLHQGITLASIIEKEVPNTDDRRVVAGIFLHRMKLGMPLESDVTVQYGADKLGVPFNTGLDSPYNTYKNKGLPPGPICNPGLDAIRAAASPVATDYLYFLAGKDGKTHFARTFAEHQQNVQQYLK